MKTYSIIIYILSISILFGCKKNEENNTYYKSNKKVCKYDGFYFDENDTLAGKIWQPK